MVNTKRYQQLLTDLNCSLLEKGPEKGRTEKDNTKSFYFRTMVHHSRQNRMAKRRNHSVGKFYLLWLTHQTWLLPIITCLHRWFTYLFISVLVRTWKNGSMIGSQLKGKTFIGVVFTNCPKDGKNVQQAMQHTLNNFYHSSEFNMFFEKEKISISYSYIW